MVGMVAFIVSSFRDNFPQVATADDDEPEVILDLSALLYLDSFGDERATPYYLYFYLIFFFQRV